MLVDDGVYVVVITDDLVLALYGQDKKWYRARVLKVTDTSSEPVVEVLYIDYGNVESVLLSKYAIYCCILQVSFIIVVFVNKIVLFAWFVDCTQ